METNRQRIMQAIQNGDVPQNPKKISANMRATIEHLHNTELAQARQSARLDNERRKFVG